MQSGHGKEDLERQRRRRAILRMWLSDQPGAWLFAMSPVIASLIVVRFDVLALWIAVAWNMCYFVQFTAARWFKSHGRSRYAKPMVVYEVIALLIGFPLLMMHPELLWWAPAYIVFATTSFIASSLRKERSLWSNAAQVAAASCMAVVVLASINNDAARGWNIAAGFALVQFGCVLYVKTMIREYGKASYLTASLVWHIALVIIGFAVSPVLGALACALLARAVTFPLAARKHRIKPSIVGAGETVATILAIGCIVAAL
ncbi:YwiC-like family protein [Bifidobacterium tsurumiense]|nr:YwiC-like family protein [Bifidobacterium tsurumiense]MDY4677505.1 YwiC-like family protein [Bifidobacterium tsurumiense]MSS12343.1 YwiC-like family protein [Bifidobacterium tsurumiense]